MCSLLSQYLSAISWPFYPEIWDSTHHIHLLPYGEAILIGRAVGDWKARREKRNTLLLFVSYSYPLHIAMVLCWGTDTIFSSILR